MIMERSSYSPTFSLKYIYFIDILSCFIFVFGTLVNLGVNTLKLYSIIITLTPKQIVVSATCS